MMRKVFKASASIINGFYKSWFYFHLLSFERNNIYDQEHFPQLRGLKNSLYLANDLPKIATFGLPSWNNSPQWCIYYGVAFVKKKVQPFFSFFILVEICQLACVRNRKLIGSFFAEWLWALPVFPEYFDVHNKTRWESH